MKRRSRSVSAVNINMEDDGEKKSQLTATDSPLRCVVCVEMKKKKMNLFKDNFVDFTTSSNLHGLKYIGDKERTPVEKIFWLLMFVCCVILCAGLIHKVWIKWNLSPVIVTFAENTTPIWQIPYPAVTLCLETKSIKTRFNFTEYYHRYFDINDIPNNMTKNMTEEEFNLFQDVLLVCRSYFDPEDGRKFSSGNETVRNIIKVAPTMDDVFMSCRRNDVNEECSQLFSPVVTEEGLCYTFNTMSADELFRIDNLNTDYSYLERLNKTQSWSLEEGYPANAPLETYPHRGTGFGIQTGLGFLLGGSLEDMDYICRGPVQGFKVLLHNPAELPRLSMHYIRVPLSQEVLVAVKPKMMTTSESLRSYSAIGRQCFFSNQRYLKYFKVYTQTNCEMECLTNFTYARCGCVHFGMPHGSEIPVCNAGSLSCMHDARGELITIAITGGVEDNANNDTLSEASRVAAECQCLPSCTSIEYEAEISQADFDFKTYITAYGIPLFAEENTVFYARVQIYFKEAQFLTSRRSELYGETDFLANCGGLLGLFLGFSVLSVVEIMYYLTLRLFCLLRKRRKNK